MDRLSSSVTWINELPDSDPMPVLFVGHGNPMNAIEDNPFSRTWKDIGKSIPRPKAILCVSAHWQTRGTWVTAMEKPKTIHDFHGFPEALFQQSYPAPGAPAYAEATRGIVTTTDIQPDSSWGLDHGTWSVLIRMFPDADIPTYQLSLDVAMSPRRHYEVASELALLRRKGVLIMGSGNIVHNLGLIQWHQEGGSDWAVEFDEMVRKFIVEKHHKPLIEYPSLGRAASLSIPTNEHYLPLLYALALQSGHDEAAFFNDRTVMGSISMTSIVFHKPA